MQRLLCFGVIAFLGPTLSGRKIKEHNIQARGLKQAPIGFSWGAKYLVTVIDSATIGGPRRRMTTVVAIFDNARDVDQAVTRLARAGFEDTVYDEGIVAGEAHSLGLIFASGSAPAVVWGTPESPTHRKPDPHAVVRAFKAHLADYRLPDEVIEAYATTFAHNGEFLLLRTKNQRAEAAVEILRNSGATRVAQHD